MKTVIVNWRKCGKTVTWPRTGHPSKTDEKARTKLVREAQEVERNWRCCSNFNRGAFNNNLLSSTSYVWSVKMFNTKNVLQSMTLNFDIILEKHTVLIRPLKTIECPCLQVQKCRMRGSFPEWKKLDGLLADSGEDFFEGKKFNMLEWEWWQCSC